MKNTSGHKEKNKYAINMLNFKEIMHSWRGSRWKDAPIIVFHFAYISKISEVK